MSCVAFWSGDVGGCWHRSRASLWNLGGAVAGRCEMSMAVWGVGDGALSKRESVWLPRNMFCYLGFMLA